MYVPYMLVSRSGLGILDEDAYRPLVIVRPDSGAGVLDVCGVKERERLFRGDDLDFDVAVLSQWACVRGFRKTRGY